MPDDPFLELSNQEISDAYIYLLARLLITRQQQVDFDSEGFVWNRLIHRKPGQVDWPNPNLDVAYSESWVAIDERSALLVTVPRIEGRYYVVEFLDGWGETVANLNERVYPEHPDGLFAICLEGSEIAIPAGAQRVEVPVKAMRVLLRVELGADWDEAISLQHQFAFEVQGDPALPEVPRTVMFDMAALPGVEAFDSAPLALDTAQDSGVGMEVLQANVRKIAVAIQDPAARQRIDRVIRHKAQPDFAAAATVIGRGTMANGWARASACGHWGDDWLTRTTVNYGGIWANVFEEVIYYRGALDRTGAELQAEGSYTLTFPAGVLPQSMARYFWSVIAVDRLHRRVLPNPLNRFLLNSQSDLTYGADGSLTLFFAPEPPDEAPEGNWLPTGGRPWSLTFRFDGPLDGVADGSYYPPPLRNR